MHQFTYTDKGWREKLVDVNKNAASVSSKPAVPSGNPRIATAKAKVLGGQAPDLVSAAAGTVSTDSADSVSSMDAAQYHFRLVLSPTATPAVKSLLEKQHRAPAAPAGAGSNGATAAPIFEPAPLNFTRTVSPKVGDGLEISPLAIATCEDIARRVVRSGGAALLVDYGEDFTQEDSLRAFQKHQQVSVLSQVHTFISYIRRVMWTSPLIFVIFFRCSARHRGCDGGCGLLDLPQSSRAPRRQGDAAADPGPVSHAHGHREPRGATAGGAGHHGRAGRDAGERAQVPGRPAADGPALQGPEHRESCAHNRHWF